ncbi:MAG: 2OG-Fe(II) oxygenase [Xanthomonadaceae bacterium]|nr:2OG-Fe(II) oxygenase [Xanthomonadaceae bacterium]
MKSSNILLPLSGDTMHAVTEPSASDPREWMLSQRDNVMTVLKSMLAAGTITPEIVETALRSHFRTKHAPDEQPPSSAMPEPALDGSPLYVDVGDRTVHVILSMVKPRAVVFGNFLSDEECEELIEIARPRMKRAKTVDHDTGRNKINPARSNDAMFFRRRENPLVARIEERVSRLVNWPVERAEGLQVLHYRPGTEYKPHYDYFKPTASGTPATLARGGQRIGTVVMYLNDVTRGGGTCFPDVGFEVAPKRGNAVFFSYPLPKPASLTLHGGNCVLEGEKWIATKWLREKEHR